MNILAAQIVCFFLSKTAKLSCASRMCSACSELSYLGLESGGGESTMDTYSVVCWAHRTVLHREITHRYRCQ